MVLIRKSVLTLSTLGTRMEPYSGVTSDGYTYSSVHVLQCLHSPETSKEHARLHAYEPLNSDLEQADVPDVS